MAVICIANMINSWATATCFNSAQLLRCNSELVMTGIGFLQRDFKLDVRVDTSRLFCSDEP